MKKTLSLILAIVLCLAMAVPASAADYTLVEHFAQSDVLKAAEWADSLDTSGRTYDEKVTIQRATEMMSDSLDYITGDFQTIWWQDHFNFEWDLITVPGSNANDRIRTLINSGDMPDVLDWTNYDVNEIAFYIEQGLFYEFPDDWRERWPSLAALQELTPVAAPFAERVGGDYTLFRITYFNNYPGETIVNHDAVYLRKDWAEAVGFELKDAYTIDEILEFARLLREQDPGQLGSRLIPIIGNTEYLGRAFVMANHPGFDDLYKEDGEYKWGFADERTLDGLKKWKDALWSGLIAPEFYTYEQSDAMNNFAVMGTCGILFAAGSPGNVANIIDNLHSEQKPNLGPDEYPENTKLHVAAIVGNDGYYYGDESVNYWGATYFSADIDEAVFERYMDMLEFHCSKEWQDVKTNGFRYLDWDYNAEGERYALHTGEEDFEGWSTETGWPLYHLMAVCGDDSDLATDVISSWAQNYTPYTLNIYETKQALLKEDSILKFDANKTSLASDNQTMVTNFDMQGIAANLLVSPGNIEEEWNKVIADNLYLIQPALDELNELFGD